MNTLRLVPAAGLAAALLASGPMLMADADAMPPGILDEVRVTVGAVGVLDAHKTGQIRAELHINQELFLNIKPYLTSGYDGSGAMHLGAGLEFTQQISDNWRFTFASGPVYYNRNGGHDLGSKLEFISYAEISTRVRPGMWVGMNFAHISNASISRMNPGIEIFGVSCSFEIQRALKL